jgi:hypothetical protein
MSESHRTSAGFEPIDPFVRRGLSTEERRKQHAIVRSGEREGALKMEMPQLNQAKMQEFGGRAVDILNKASLALMMSVGHRTGLFEAMAGFSPSTARQIADAARLQERYVREWLGAMVTGSVVEYDAENGTSS